MQILQRVRFIKWWQVRPLILNQRTCFSFLILMTIRSQFKLYPQLILNLSWQQIIPEQFIICRLKIRPYHQVKHHLLVHVPDPAPEVPLVLTAKLSDHFLGDTPRPVLDPVLLVYLLGEPPHLGHVAFILEVVQRQLMLSRAEHEEGHGEGSRVALLIKEDVIVGLREEGVLRVEGAEEAVDKEFELGGKVFVRAIV